MNLVLMTGVATDAELRYTPSGNPILNFRISGVRSIRRPDGDPVEVFSSHRVALYGSRAERWTSVLADNPLPQPVHAVTRLRSWASEQPDGTKRFGTNIDVDQLHLLPGQHEIREGEYGPLLVGGFSRAMLLGNNVRDNDLRYTPNGHAVANLTIAVNEYDPVNKTERANFISVTCWGEALATIAAESKKGTPLRVTGSLHLSSWEKDGEKRYQLRVNADDIVRLASPAFPDAPERATKPAATSTAKPATTPAAATRPQPALDIDEFPPEEDLPF